MPLDRNAKARIMILARALTHRAEPGKHYGILTAKFIKALEALLWGFHNAATGRCFPSYERIAERADCARSTVYEAITALERAGRRRFRIEFGAVGSYHERVCAPALRGLRGRAAGPFCVPGASPHALWQEARA